MLNVTREPLELHEKKIKKFHLPVKLAREKFAKKHLWNDFQSLKNFSRVTFFFHRKKTNKTLQSLWNWQFHRTMVPISHRKNYSTNQRGREGRLVSKDNVKITCGNGVCRKVMISWLVELYILWLHFHLKIFENWQFHSKTILLGHIRNYSTIERGRNRRRVPKDNAREWECATIWWNLVSLNFTSP